MIYRCQKNNPGFLYNFRTIIYSANNMKTLFLRLQTGFYSVLIMAQQPLILKKYSSFLYCP